MAAAAAVPAAARPRAATRTAAPRVSFTAGCATVAGSIAARAGLPVSGGAPALWGAVASAALLRKVALRGLQRRRSRRRRGLARSAAASTEDGGARPGLLSITQVAECWEAAEGLGRSLDDIANQCAWLCCVQRQLGYFAALHEGNVGRGEVISRAPRLPLVLTWEGPEGSEETYGTSLSPGTASASAGSASRGGADAGVPTLLEELLACNTQAEGDKRWGNPCHNDRQLQVKVSLMRGFVDITESPFDWTAGEHGLWYREASTTGASCVYLPEVVERLAGDLFQDGLDTAQRRVLSALVKGAAPGGSKSANEAISTEASDPAPPQEGGASSRIAEGRGAVQFPEAGVLYRFEVLQKACSVGNLPTFKRREVRQDHIRQLLIAQARIQVDSVPQGAAFAALTALPALADGSQATEVVAGDGESTRAFIVPSFGAYSNAHLSFAETVSRNGAWGLSTVRRIVVIAPVWDCYIDGCGLPERRCASYGGIELDMVTLEKLRSSGAFVELSTEQEERERAIEAIIPLVRSCVAEDQAFMLVPILVGGLVWQKAEVYTRLLAPYLADPTTLFVVAGDVNELDEEMSMDRVPSAMDSPERWMRNVPTLSSGGGGLATDELAPVFDSLELFLAALAQVPQGQRLRLQRY